MNSELSDGIISSDWRALVTLFTARCNANMDGALAALINHRHHHHHPHPTQPLSVTPHRPIVYCVVWGLRFRSAALGGRSVGAPTRRPFQGPSTRLSSSPRRSFRSSSRRALNGGVTMLCGIIPHARCSGVRYGGRRGCLLLNLNTLESTIQEVSATVPG